MPFIVDGRRVGLVVIAQHIVADCQDPEDELLTDIAWQIPRRGDTAAFLAIMIQETTYFRDSVGGLFTLSTTFTMFCSSPDNLTHGG